MCEYAPSGVLGTLCGFFPKNGVANLVELAVDMEKRVDISVRVVREVVARSIVSVSKVFADHVEQLDGD
jgi:hypothetical protein